MMIIIKQNICNIFNKTKNRAFIATKCEILVCHSCIMMIFQHANFLGPVQIHGPSNSLLDFKIHFNEVWLQKLGQPSTLLHSDAIANPQSTTCIEVIKDCLFWTIYFKFETC